MEVGKTYQLTLKGLTGKKRVEVQIVKTVAEYEKFYLGKAQHCKITIMKSAIRTGECKFEEIEQSAS